MSNHDSEIIRSSIIPGHFDTLFGEGINEKSEDLSDELDEEPMDLGKSLTRLVAMGEIDRYLTQDSLLPERRLLK